MEALFPSDPARRARLARGLAWLAVAAAIVLIARAMHKTGGVIELNRAFGERFLAGADPWFDVERGQRVHGPYPPSLAWVAVPLSLLPLTLARGLWAAGQVAALAVAYRWLVRRAREDEPRAAVHAPMLFAISVLLTSRFLLRDFAGGGGNVIYGTLAFVGVEAALAGRAIGGAAALGLSLALKPNLVSLIAFLALVRRPKAALAALAFAAAFFWLPALHFGPAAYADLAREWFDGVRAYVALEDLHSAAAIPAGLPVAADGMNQSLREAVHRLFRPPGDSGAVDLHAWELSASTAAALARGLALALVAWVAFVTLKARTSRAQGLALQTYFPLALLTSPITWKAHHACLVPLFFRWTSAIVERGTAARGSVGFLGLYYVACNLLSEDVAGKQAKRVLQAASIVTWFDIALLIGVGAMALARARDAKTGSMPGRADDDTDASRRGGTT